jgi:osmotically-inducible protein OsmY
MSPEARSAVEEAVAGRITETLEDAGISIGLEFAEGAVVLMGEVESEENRQAALDVANAVAEPRGLRVVDALEVMDWSPDSAFAADPMPLADEPWTANTADADPNRLAAEMDPDLTDDLGTTDPEESTAEAIPYYPPTDPVVRPITGDESIEILSGFGPGAEGSDTGEGAAPGDEDIAEAVAGALRRDALTSDLAISVLVRNGVVYLRGHVPSADDAAAEAIAGDVPGVVEVREELGTGTLES